MSSGDFIPTQFFSDSEIQEKLALINALETRLSTAEHDQEALKRAVRARDELLDRSRGRMLELEEKIFYVETIKEENTRLAEKLAKAEKDNEAIKRTVCGRDNLINSMRAKMTDLDEQVLIVDDLKEQVETLKRCICARDEMINNFRVRISDLDEAAEGLKVKIEEAEKVNDATKRTVCGRDNLINTLRSRISDLDEKLFAADEIKEQVESLKRGICTRDEMINNFRVRISDLDEVAEGLKVKLEEANDANEATKRTVCGRDNLINSMRAKMTDLDEQIFRIENLKEQELEVVEKEKTALKASVCARDELINNLRSRLSELDEHLDIKTTEFEKEQETMKRLIRCRDSLINDFRTRNVELEEQLVFLEDIKGELAEAKLENENLLKSFEEAVHAKDLKEWRQGGASRTQIPEVGSAGIPKKRAGKFVENPNAYVDV
jgi:chromosome segregation ATPase